MEDHGVVQHNHEKEAASGLGAWARRRDFTTLVGPEPRGAKNFLDAGCRQRERWGGFGDGGWGVEAYANDSTGYLCGVVFQDRRRLPQDRIEFPIDQFMNQLLRP